MNKKQIIATTSAAALALTIGIGGTMAYLTSVTDPITNTFTVGNVALELKETKGTGNDTSKNFTVSPGTSVAKDPTVTVKANSEKCYVFVKVVETDPHSAINWTKADGWTELQDASSEGTTVLYRTVSSAEMGSPIYVLAGDPEHANGMVTISSEVTGSIDGTQLTFTGYAIQTAGFTDVNTAWDNVKNVPANSQP